MKPSASTLASVGIGIPAATVIAWLVTVVAHIEMPGPVEAALGALISAVVGYVFRGGMQSDVEPKESSNAP